MALDIILERKTICWYHERKDKKHPLHNDPFCRTILNNAGSYSNSGHIIVVVTFNHPSIIYARVSAEIVQKVCQTCEKKNETRNETCNVKSDLVIVVWSIISCLLVKFPYVSSCYCKIGNLLTNTIPLYGGSESCYRYTTIWLSLISIHTNQNFPYKKHIFY